MTFFSDFVGNQPVPFPRFRQMWRDSPLQEGVYAAGDLQVTQRGAGANMSVDVATGDGWIQVDTGTRNGLAHVVSDAIANVTITAAHATLPRVDQIIVRFNDSSIPAGTGGNVPTCEVLTGTATSGANLDANRSPSAAALPNDCLRLADVLVGAAAGSITNAVIRDRRTWARGAYDVIQRTAGSYTTASATMALIDGTNLQPRIECSGVPLRLSLRGRTSPMIASGALVLVPFIDGAQPAGGTDILAVSGTAEPFISLAWDFVPAAGSHLLGWAWRSTGAVTATLLAVPSTPLEMVVEEIVRQNTPNNVVTSG